MHTIKVDNPNSFNMVVGQFPYIKTIDEIHHVLVESVPGIKFGLAFNETSQPVTVRSAGTDNSLIDLARKNADNIGAQDTFVLFLGESSPVPAMKALKHVPDISQIYCATAGQVEVIVSDGVGGILGLLGGYSGEDEKEVHVLKKNKTFFERLSHRN